MCSFNNLSRLAIITLVSLWGSCASAQTATNLNALKGFAPFSTLLTTAAGKAALAYNFAITGAIQNGTANQPALQPFAQQQAQALKDATITSANAHQLADGFGTKLGKAYHLLTSYPKPATGEKPKNISPSIANLFGYTLTLTESDASAAKYFFANETTVTTTSTAPVSAAGAAIMKEVRGTTDVLGKAYNDPAGSAGADPSGNSRPFQTEGKVLKYSGADYFGDLTENEFLLEGPIQKLKSSPAFPSGHTTYGYTESLLLAIMVPERFPQMITRAAEYGNSRIVLGAHYAMDVIGGRTLAYYDIAQLLAENPIYLGQKEGKFKPITSYQVALQSATLDFRRALQNACGATISACAAVDTSRFSNPAANEVFYESTQTYGLPVVYQATANKIENVAVIAPEAGDILLAGFPKLTLMQADHILTITEGPGGGFLDDGSAFGLYSRLDLYKASIEAAAYK